MSRPEEVKRTKSKNVCTKNAKIFALFCFDKLFLQIKSNSRQKRKKYICQNMQELPVIFNIIADLCI